MQLAQPKNTALVSGLILAGGQSSRLGGEHKALKPLLGKALYRWVLKQIQDDIDHCYISCPPNSPIGNDPLLTVIYDHRSAFCGPLAGIESGLSHINDGYLLVSPCDTPWIPKDLGPTLLSEARRHNADICYASDGVNQHYLCALIHKRVATALNAYLDQGERKVSAFFQTQNSREISRPHWHHCFDNLNSPRDFLQAEQALKKAP